MQNKQFTIRGAAVLLVIFVVGISLIMPAIHACRHGEYRIAGSVPLRGIHQGFVAYANSNNGYYAGLNAAGEDADWITYSGFPKAFRRPIRVESGEGLSVEHRYQFLIEGDFFSPGYAVSPSENDDTIQAWDLQGVMTPEHYSYAMLQIPAEGGRRAEWRADLNRQAIVMSDRNTGSRNKPHSIHNEPRDIGWKGSVLWNDNHVAFEEEDQFTTQYGDGELNEEDRLFSSRGNDDALLIHSGN